MSKRTWLCGTALALIFVGATRPAGAEWFLDLYGGGSFTQDVDVTIRNGTTQPARRPDRPRNPLESRSHPGDFPEVLRL
jgi:hypothetical protein